MFGLIERFLDKHFERLEIRGGCDNMSKSTPVYMKRWFIKKGWGNGTWNDAVKRKGESEPQRSGDFAILVHKIMRSDEDKELHDHPWGFLSFIVRNGYIEETPGGRFKRIRPFSIIFRPAVWRHRVIIPDGNGPAWSIVFTGKKSKSWSFFDQAGKGTPWRDFLKAKCEKRREIQ